MSRGTQLIRIRGGIQTQVHQAPEPSSLIPTAQLPHGDPHFRVALDKAFLHSVPQSPYSHSGKKTSQTELVGPGSAQPSLDVPSLAEGGGGGVSRLRVLEPWCCWALQDLVVQLLGWQ